MRNDRERDVLDSDEPIRSLSAYKSADELEDEIARIRDEMDRTLSAIERKLDSGEILRRVQDYFATGPGEFGSNLSRIVKENPIPVLMVGIGLAWLGLAGAREKGREAEKMYLEAYEKFERKRRRRESWKDLSHAVTRFRGKIRRTRKEVAASAEPERIRSRRSYRSARRKELSIRHRTPLTSSVGAALGAAFGAALPKRR